MAEEAIIGLRTTKAAAQECGDFNNVPVTLDMVKAAENSYWIIMNTETGASKHRRRLKD